MCRPILWVLVGAALTLPWLAVKDGRTFSQVHMVQLYCKAGLLVDHEYADRWGPGPGKYSSVVQEWLAASQAGLLSAGAVTTCTLQAKPLSYAMLKCRLDSLPWQAPGELFMPVMLPMKESSRCGGISDCITLYQETHLLQQLPAPSAGEHCPAGPPWGPPSCSNLCMALGACMSLTSPLCRTVLPPRQRAHLHRHPVMCGHCQQHEPHHSAPWLPFCPAGPCCFKSMSDSPPSLPCEAWQLPEYHLQPFCISFASVLPCRARLLPEHHHLALPDILHQVLCERNLLLGINHVLQDSGRVTAATFIRLAKLFHSHLFQLAAPSADGPLTDRKGSIYTVRQLHSGSAWGSTYT